MPTTDPAIPSEGSSVDTADLEFNLGEKYDYSSFSNPGGSSIAVGEINGSGILITRTRNLNGTFRSVWSVGGSGTDFDRISTESGTGSQYSLSKSGNDLIYTDLTGSSFDLSFRAFFIGLS